MGIQIFLCRLPGGEFQAVLVPVCEKSSWIADRTWERRPFSDRAQLLAEMTKTVEQTGESALVELIGAHPGIAARVEERLALTSESLHEQSACFISLIKNSAAFANSMPQRIVNALDFPS